MQPKQQQHHDQNKTSINVKNKRNKRTKDKIQNEHAVVELQLV